ncbi:MAG: hypothetical protein Q7U54_05465 [Bacteroidales bacterium]|nr:hypothetical protein [Bacteroidales bacterium]
MKILKIITLILTVVLFSIPAISQDKLNSGMLSKMEFRNLGAYRAGAWVSAIAVPENPGEKYKYTFFVAGRNGGVWKTVNNGTTFYPVFEKYGVTTIGAMAVAPSNPDAVWVGTGEAYNARSSFAGNGIYKSTDGGETYTNMGLKDSHHIAKIIVDPKNADVVYVASMGHLYSTNAERGVIKTTDGGKTWEKVLFVDDKTGVIDMIMDPSNPSVLYAAAYEKTRYPWHFEAGGKGSGVYKTIDGGKTWSKTLSGLPDGQLGRIGLAISNSNPKIVYAVVENLNPKDPTKELKTEGMMNTSRDNYYDQLKGGEVYRSENGGQSWLKMNEDKYNVSSKAAYSFNQIYCNTQNPDNLWVISDVMHISFDGGKTWTGFEGDTTHYLEAMFGDHRTMWIDPHDGNHMLLGSDGGIYETFDAGKTTRHFYQIPIEEIYAVGYDFHTPYNIYIGLQDHDVWRGPSNSWAGEIGPEEWTVVGSGDGMYCRVDKETGRWIYSTGQFGQQLLLDAWTGKSTQIMPKAAEGKPAYRYTWATPLILSPHNSSIVYTAAQMMLRSVNQGKTWEEISPDLTTNDPVKQNGRGHIKYCTITTFDESPIQPGILWAGTDDGKVQCTYNNGSSWTDCTPALITAGCPAGFWTTRVVPSANDQATAYVSFSGYTKDDFRSLLFKTTDNGKTWKTISSNLPDQPINVITEDADNKNLLFVGTDGGLYVTVNGGTEWVKFEQIPAVPVKDIAIHPRENDLIVATYGRGVYITNILPLKQLNDTVFANHAVLFPVKCKPLKNYSDAAWIGNRRLMGDTHLFTPNEPNAFEIYYYVNQDQFIAPKKKQQLVLPVIEVRSEADSLLKSFQVKESGFGKVELPFRNLQKGRYSVVLKSNGTNYKQTAVIKEAWQWPVGNFDMQKP